MKILDAAFYQRPDTLQIAQELLGKELVTRFDGQTTSGIIVEVEAYLGEVDRASHAYGRRRTKRTEIMFAPGGFAYVYLCYGVHHLFNVITHHAEEPHAILVRAVEPQHGIEIMLQRRKMPHPKPALTAGPGALSKALGITTAHTGMPLGGDEIHIRDTGRGYTATETILSPRVGVDYAGADALLPYRFRVKNNIWTSPAP